MANINEMINLAQYQAGPGRLTGRGGGGGIFDMVAGIVEKRKAEEEINQKKEIESKQRRIDMYKTLRDSGYTPAQAHKAVMEDKFPDVPGQQTEDEKSDALNQQKTKAQINKEKALAGKYRKQTSLLTQKPEDLKEGILRKLANDEALTAGEQRIYDEVIKKSSGESDIQQQIDEARLEKLQQDTKRSKALTEKSGRKPTEKSVKQNVRERILNKLANDEALTSGEQKIYDEIIKKSSNQSELSQILSGQSKKSAVPADVQSKSAEGEYIKMFDPAGKPKLVPAQNVNKALSRGWKLR